MTDTTLTQLPPPYPAKPAKKPQRPAIRRPKVARHVASPKYLARYILRVVK